MRVKALTIRPLNLEDMQGVQTLDDLSGNDLMSWLEDNYDYAWGAFLDNELIGYCSIGFADELKDILSNIDYLDYNPNSLMVKDLFITEENRNVGYGSVLLQTAMNYRLKINPENIFVYAPNTTIELCNFLYKNGIELQESRNGIFVKEQDTKELEKDAELNEELELEA